jgi:uncharacterized membrane protein YheB (UPF0754 family)
MFPLADWIIPPAAGAVIGYFTNWLAIKMLFRPLREKRLFGLRLPFTPGLIPKERRVLAKKIGAALTQHVLTPDAVADAIVTAEILESIEQGIAKALDALLSDPKPLRAWLADFAPPAVENPVENVYNMDGERAWDAVYKNITRLLSKHFIENEGFITQCLPAGAQTAAENLLETYIPRLAGALADLLFENPANDRKLHGLLTRLIEENLGLAGFFINKEKAYASVKKTLTASLRDPENLAGLTLRAKSWLAEALARPVRDLAPWLNETWLAENIRPLLRQGAQALLAMTPGELFRHALKGSALETLKKFLAKLARPAVTKAAAFLAENVRLGELVEERMNRFEMEEAERILLSVVDRELRAITWLGGLLGLLIGLATALLGRL